MPPNHNINITIVVNGVATAVKANVEQKVRNMVREALREAGQKDADPKDWELKTKDGVLLNQDLRIGDAGITSGVTMFLSLAAGGGG
jgi:hypothetical protein